MPSVSAESPSFPMNCMAWSLFSDRADSYGSSCNESRPGISFFPRLVNSEIARSRLLGGGLENEDDGRESVCKSLGLCLCLGGNNCQCPDANSVEGLAFENFEGLGIPKDGDGARGLAIPMSSSPNNNNNNGNGGAPVGSPGVNEAIDALQKYLPCNNEDEERWPGVDAYSCDEFRMYEFKVRRCTRGRSHDWTECPFAHPGEKARRRDPRRFHYSGTACPDFRKGSCRRGDACEFAHGVFECWLHPARYRTQPCKDGRNCRRRVCFFAHTPQQLRLLAYQPNVGARSGGSPFRHSHSLEGVVECANHLAAGSPRGRMGYFGNASQVNLCSAVVSSPTSTLVGHSHSPPPLSPSGSPPLSPVGISCSGAKGEYLKAILSPSSLAQVRNSPTSGSQNVAGATGTMARMTTPPSDPVSTPRSPILPPPVGCSHSAPPPALVQSPNVITELINSLQRLEVNGSAVSPWLRAEMAAGRNSPMLSNFRYCSQGLPRARAKTGWAGTYCETELMEEPVQRVESGRDLRAKIYGRLIRDNLQEPFESPPDLGWVNELVK